MAESSLQNAIKVTFENLIAGVHTSTIGKIESYEYSKQKASVKPLITRTNGNGIIEEYPVIADVPVLFFASGGASITFPVSKGDFVLLIFAERSIDDWLSKGSQIIANLSRRFDISDCIAIPGILPFTSDSQAENNNDVLLTYGDARVTLKKNGNIEIDGGNIKLGSGVLKALMTDTMIAIYNAHIHTGGTISGNTGAPTPLLSSALHATQKTTAE